MSSRLWNQLGALSGIVFAVLATAGGFLPGNPPDLDASGDKVAEFFSDKDKQILVGAYLNGLAIPFFLWFAVTLRRRLEAAQADPVFTGVAIGAVVATIPLAIAGAAFGSVGALRVDEGLDADTLQAFYSLFTIFGTGAVAFTVMAFLGAVAIASLRSHAFPTWLGWLTALVALGWLVPGLAVASDPNWLIECGLGAFGATTVWVIVVSGFMFRDASKSTA